MNNLFLILFSLPIFLFSNETEVDMNKKEPKVVGIGGIFFKSDNPEDTKKWYKENLVLEPVEKLGIDTNLWVWKQPDYT